MRFPQLSRIGKRNLAISGALTLFLIALDQWVKVLAVNHLKGQIGYTFLDGFVVVEYAENRGAFLSLGATLSDEARLWIFVVGVVFILAFCIYSMFKVLDNAAMAIAFSLVIAGGIGNLVDRIAQGYVVDYVHMGFFSLRTGVFNIADVAISAGLILLVFLQYREKEA